MATDTFRTPAQLSQSQVRVFNNFIDGEWVEASTGETFENRNPADTRDLVGIFQKSSKTDVDDAVETLRDLPITVDRVDERLFVGNELRLARHYDLTAYDAAYLALALHHGAVLATRDAELCRAAKDLGLDLFTD